MVMVVHSGEFQGGLTQLVRTNDLAWFITNGLRNAN